MVKGTRNKVKEQFERAHVNSDWIIYHYDKAIGLIGDKNPKLVEGLKSLIGGIEAIDKLAMGIYSKL